MDRLNQLMQSGCSLVLDSLDSFDPTMEIACRALQWWSREIVQVNTYLTTNDAAGFSLHWDDHDVIIVQIGGEKSWEVRSASRPVPMYRDAEPNIVPPEEILWSGTLRTGDVMHIPRGFWHQATRTDRGAGYSLHVTFGFVKRTGVDWMSWVADRSREREPFRHDLHRWETSDRAAQEDGLVAGMAQLLADYPISAYLAAREHERQPPRHVATGGVFGPPQAVVCLTDFSPRIEVRGQEVDVLAAGKKMIFAAQAEPALRLLLAGHPIDLATVTATTGIDAVVLAESLIKEGVCAELTVALSSGYTGMIPTGTCSNTP
ncbi:JmjC domain-containing protein [Nocardia nepalensis]|uniref:JmjC domain-containing protein n=1 Tax=Nocardia nepalensis TaxID=3375448 RepID=UPI003B677E96